MNIKTGKFMAVAILLISMAVPAAHAKTHIKINSADLALAQKIESQLKDSGILETGLTEVRVEAKNGDIILSGWLQHADDDRKVIAATKNIEGVGSVKANFRTWSSRRHPF